MNLIKQIFIFAYRVWPLTFIIALAVGAMIVGPETPYSTPSNTKIYCGNKATQEFTAGLIAREHNVSLDIAKMALNEKCL